MAESDEMYGKLQENVVIEKRQIAVLSISADGSVLKTEIIGTLATEADWDKGVSPEVVSFEVLPQ